jgi:DNA-binding SARP family transcriptional activator
MNIPPDPDFSDPAAPPETRDVQFELTLLGTFQLTEDGEVVPIREREQRMLALLAIRDRTIGRLALAGILWPDASDAHALSSLRAALSQLPPRLRGQLRVTPYDLTLPDTLSVDLRRARLLTQQLLALPPTLPVPNKTQPALILLSSDLLPDWYEEWAVERNREWHSIRALALESWSVTLLALGRFGEAVQTAIAAINAEPLGEGAVTPR